MAVTQSPLLEGLRPECEAVMRALFCRVDRCVGAPGRRARLRPTFWLAPVETSRISRSCTRVVVDLSFVPRPASYEKCFTNVLKMSVDPCPLSTCTPFLSRRTCWVRTWLAVPHLSRLGTGAVRARRLLDVLRSDCGVSEVMEAAVGKSRWRAALDSMEATLCHPVTDSCTTATTNDDGGLANEHATTTAARSSSIGTRCSAERDVTWGEFLLFFLPSAGNADDAYNAGLISRFLGDSGCGGGFPDENASVRDAGGGGRRRFGAVSEDAAAMLQMVVPTHWTAAGGGEGGGRLAALSVGQLRREVLRLAKERAFLLALVREDGRLGKRRAEAVHDQYRHELRALQSKKG